MRSSGGLAATMIDEGCFPVLTAVNVGHVDEKKRRILFTIRSERDGTAPTEHVSNIAI